MIDLHSHSTASDGRLSPRELVLLAARDGLKALALTDHDTIAGWDDAERSARETGLVFVPGVEIEIESPTGEFHLLALGLSRSCPDLEAELGRLRESREERNLKIFQKMKEAGVSGEYAEVVESALGGVVGRPHLARFLVQKGRVASVKEAFDKFLGRGQMFYEKKAGLDLARALELVHRAGGIALVAHPLSLYLSLAKLEERFTEWKDLGLDGLEAYHPGAPLAKCQQLEDLGRRLGLRISAGSDFHGDNRPDRRLGHTSGGRPIGDEFYKEVLGIDLPAADN